MGGIIKDSIINEKLFTVKGQSTTLPNVTDALREASVWDVCPPDDSKFHI